MTSAAQRPWMPCPASVHALQAQGRRIDVPHRDGAVCGRRFGNGPPLVLLHGGHGSWMHWLHNIATLAQRHTVWVPDLPGFGDSSEVPDDGSTHGPLARLVDALDDTLAVVAGNDHAVDLAAFSFGALVAVHLHRRGRCLRRLSLLGPAAHSGPRVWHEVDAAAHWVQYERADAINALRLSWFAAPVEQTA